MDSTSFIVLTQTQHLYRQRANGLCSKTERSSECTTSSLTENWAHHEISLRLKKRRKVERVQPARVLVSEEVERFRSAYGPEEHLPEDFNVQHNVNKKRLATVIHERDQIDKPECSAGGVPLDLIRYPVTTDHDGNIVTEQLIYEFPDFTAFIRVQNLIYLMTMPTISALRWRKTTKST